VPLFVMIYEHLLDLLEIGRDNEHINRK